MAGSSDTVPAKLAGGEFVIKRGSAEMIPKPFLEFLNGLSDNAAHDNIDALITEATPVSYTHLTLPTICSV